MKTFWQNIQSQLEEYVNQIGLAALVLANEDGLLIASAGCAVDDAELVAAVGPFHQSSSGSLVKEVNQKLHQKGLNLGVLDIKKGKQSIYLCATGKGEECNDPQLKNILEDVAERVGL